MAMYIVTVWESMDLGGMCYEWKTKFVVPETDLEGLNEMDVESVELMD